MVTYTSSNLYWSPLKPRIRIYSFGDSTYSNALYTYDPFTDAGETTKPIALNFDSQTTNVGTFSLEIEDKDYELDPDTFMRGNRVFIDCSKDGSTYQPAFKGLVRSTDQNIYAVTGRNLVINGFSYLVRLNERVINTIKESTLSGEDYDRTDSNMFSDNLINDLLTTNSNYVYSDDDTALYSIFKKNNITSSPVTDWIPRLDAQLVTVNDAINSVLEFSNSLVMLNPADDELVLYNPDNVTSATDIFLLTNQVNNNADDADYTMYPLESYKYNISYDYPDSGSRLIGSIGGAGQCLPIVQDPDPDPCASLDADNVPLSWVSSGLNYMRACEFRAEQTTMKGLRIELQSGGDFSHVANNLLKAQVRTKNQSGVGTHPNTGSQVGSTMTFYRDRITTRTFPEYSTCSWFAGLPLGETGVTGLTIGLRYWLVVWLNYNLASDGSSDLRWVTEDMHNRDCFQVDVNSAGWPNPSSANWTATSAVNDGLESLRDGPIPKLSMDFGRDITQEDGCGGSQATIDADPVFAVAHDRNMSNRLGVVEKVMSAIPTHIKTRQTLEEYLFNKLYYSAKPRFTFDFPSVSMPNKLPKAGDICAHVDTRAKVGLITAPVQTGVISQVQYDFAQGKGKDDTLGLRRIGLSTTGVRRGSY